MMHRRGLLKAAATGALVAASGLAALLLSLAADSKVLRFVPRATLANLDPIWTTFYVARDAFRLRLKQPFAKLLYAPGKCGTPCAFIMPERLT
jgi:hypothetical protein